ncbi:MAG: ATP-binding cassette domain-containing protein [Acidimicrobiia bacterium]
MPAVHLENVSFSYPSANDVLTDVTIDLGQGWTGVVGANGSGKSTMLALISRDLVPVSGTVAVDPSSAPLEICPQEVEHATSEIEAFAGATDGIARGWMGRLEIDPSTFARWTSLSPGERKRWQIGAALAREPAVLLLDEPTNHIDSDARAVLMSALGSFKGVGLVVSHDRTLLNTLTTNTLLVDGGTAVLWGGPYEVARAGWEAERLQTQASYDKTVREQKKQRRRLADQRRAAELKRAQQRRKLRHAGAKDKDARSMEQKGRYESGEASGNRQLEVTRAALERTDAQVSSFEMVRDLGRSVFLDYEPARKSLLLKYVGPLQVGEHTLVSHVDVALMRDDRVQLHGRNGAGKTTLLREMMAASHLPADRVLCLPQELTESDVSDLLGLLDSLDSSTKGDVLSLVAALGADPKRLLASDDPSPGEARKLSMAFGLALSPWCVLLDEPTNHLDLPSVERLQAALSVYPGAVLLISHDEEFADALTQPTWHLTTTGVSTN